AYGRLAPARSAAASGRWRSRRTAATCSQPTPTGRYTSSAWGRFRKQTEGPRLPARAAVRDEPRESDPMLAQREVYERVSATCVEALNVDEEEIQPTSTL